MFIANTLFVCCIIVNLLISHQTYITSLLTYRNNFTTISVPNLKQSLWYPLFKRSSYIGLVWKSQWKL